MKRKIAVFPARTWNALADDVRRVWPWRGPNCRLSPETDDDGHVIEATAHDEFSHPWRVRCAWEFYPREKRTEKRRGSWRATIEPGFVNGRDVYVSTEVEGVPVDVELTAETPPALELTNLRNPLGAGLDAAATISGSLVFTPGEGYPAFFESLGVRPAAKGGQGLAGQSLPDVPGRDRELRAVDLVLVTPRLGSALEVTTHDPGSTGFTHQIGVTFSNANFVAKKGRSFVRTTAKFQPFDAGFTNSPFLALPMNAGDPQFEEIKLATVYLVSPASAGSDAEPDETWEAYPRHSVFWNLAFATRFKPPAQAQEPLRISTGLGAGLLDWLGNSMLAPINSAMQEVGSFLNQSDMRGKFWSV